MAVDVPLQEALEALIDQTSLNLVFDNRLVNGAKSHCRAVRQPIEGVLRCVLDGTGLDFIRLSSGTYSIVRAPAVRPLSGLLTGSVLDLTTGLPLAGANIVVAGITHGPRGTSSNRAGRFVLPGLLPGPHRLIVTFVGYADRVFDVDIVAGATLNHPVALRQAIFYTAPVVVTSRPRARRSESLGKGSLNTSEFSAVPAGVHSPSPDVLAALGAVVGVRAADALSDIHVQGGSVGENQLTLDGAPVYAPVSLGGLIGPMSPFAIERATVRKAGFGALSGSHLSGVIEAEHLYAPPAGQSALLQADAMALNARVGGHRSQSRASDASWVATLRRSTSESSRFASLRDRLNSWSAPDSFLIGSLGLDPSADQAQPVELRFLDAHAAGRVQFRGVRSLSASAYFGQHAFGAEHIAGENAPHSELLEDAYRWTNVTAQAQYEWVQSGRAFASVGAWTSGYRVSRPSAFGAVLTDDTNSITASGIRLGLDAYPSARHAVSAQLETTAYASAVAVALGPDRRVDDSEIDPAVVMIAGAVEDQIDLGAKTLLTLGSRWTWLPEFGRFYSEPRAIARRDIPDFFLGSLAVRVAGGRYLQFVNALDLSDGGPAPVLPQVRFWSPIGRSERPQEAYHLAAEASLLPGKGGPWEIVSEFYAKWQPHIYVPGYGEGDGLLVPASGSAYGAALGLNYRVGRLRASGTYELSRSRMLVPGRFRGVSVPIPWDAPHRFRLSVDAGASSNLTLTARVEAVVGRRWAFRRAYYDLLEPNEETRIAGPFDFSDPAAHRLPAFIQIDLNAAYSLQLAGGLAMQLRGGMVNVLARDNIRDWSLYQDSANGPFLVRPRYGMPFVPEISLRLTR